jgi:phosphotransferase system enzyme I (PtsI)
MSTLKGIAASAGIAIGRAYIYRPDDVILDLESHDSISGEEKLKAISLANESVHHQVKALYTRMKEQGKSKEAEIFSAYEMFLDDPTLQEAMERYARQGYSTAATVHRAYEDSAQLMDNLADAYFRERAKDIRDIGDRVVRALLGMPKADLRALPYPAIVVARDLAPADTASVDRENVLGFVTEQGSTTSHTAILAQALGLPAVVGLGTALAGIDEHARLGVDGAAGTVVLDPTPEERATLEERARALAAEQELLTQYKDKEVVLGNGKRIEVSANIGGPGDVATALRFGADGVGLYRTEFLFLDRDSPPTEEEQVEAYRSVLTAFGSKPVIIRTLDIGGDKQIPYLHLPAEANPFLGVRATRLGLRRPTLFKTQLRAILRASTAGTTRIMYPMIAVAEEIEQANLLLQSVRKELDAEGTAYDHNLEVGIMVEIPSAALDAERLADRVDFFSIGTNDLTQYTFAADRTNRDLNYLYQPLHPAVLSLIRMTIEAAHAHGKWVGVCGELAGDPQAIPVLIAMGIDELSMSSAKIPRAKQIILSL